MKKILIHLSSMVAIVVVLALGILWYLGTYTNHSSELIVVQDLEGKTGRAAMKLLNEAGLQGVVMDTVYKDGVPKNTVINQNPVAGLSVKAGRKVYLVINTNKIPMVAVPDLAGKTSLLQARNMLLRRHLKVGKIIKQVHSSVKTKSDEPVLDQYEAGTTVTILPNTLIERNSYIDLVIGIPDDYYDIADSTLNEEIY